MPFTYIIHSDSLNKFYSGSTTQNLDDRIYKHNLKHAGFTGKANDWKVVYSKEFSEISEARSLEKRIKKNGAKRFLERL